MGGGQSQAVSTSMFRCCGSAEGEVFSLPIPITSDTSSRVRSHSLVRQTEDIEEEVLKMGQKWAFLEGGGFSFCRSFSREI